MAAGADNEQFARDFFAAMGPVVLTEQVDSMYRADGTKIMEFRLMSATELVDGLVVRYTDYLDTASLAAGLRAVAAVAVHP